MFRHVRDPQLTRLRAGELPFDVVGRDGVGPTSLPLRPARGTGDAGPAHQHLDRAVTDIDPVAESQLRVHPARTVGAARVEMDLTDQIVRQA